ncbi:MAG: branched-chain amino acid ABC transporter permease [Clostridia bacterium]|nr:branched-chain amino acid ABC transporter permease [Clostridia bacterium]
MLIAAALILFLILELTGVLRRSHANLLAQVGFSIILAVSLNLVVGFLGELSLGHAGFMCAGAYIGCFVANQLHKTSLPPLVTLIVAMAVGGIVAALFGFVVGLPALRLKGDYLAIVTLAFGEIVRNICKNLPWFGGAMGLPTEQYGTHLFIVAFAVVLLMLILTQNLIHSKHGRAITAIRDNEIAARAMGINVVFYKLFVFVFTAFFAGVAGVIYGYYTTPVIYSSFTFNYSIEILVMVVLGGMGNITGSILSASLITVVNFVLQSNLSGDQAAIKYLVYALILMVTILFNNAPAFRPIKEKIGLQAILSRVRKKFGLKHPSENPEEIVDDSAKWHRIPTKIKMDSILSTDLKPADDGTLEPDPRQEDKHE